MEDHEDFHLTEGMADKAITWMRRHLAINANTSSSWNVKYGPVISRKWPSSLAV